MAAKQRPNRTKTTKDRKSGAAVVSEDVFKECGSFLVVKYGHYIDFHEWIPTV